MNGLTLRHPDQHLGSAIISVARHRQAAWDLLHLQAPTLADVYANEPVSFRLPDHFPGRLKLVTAQ